MPAASKSIVWLLAADILHGFVGAADDGVSVAGFAAPASRLRRAGSRASRPSAQRRRDTVEQRVSGLPADVLVVP